MLRPDLFDRYDMERRIHERLFCFGSDSADDDSGGGSDPAPDDTQANYEREAFGDSRDGVNFRSAPSQPRESDSSPAQALAAVTGISPTLVEMAQSATPAQRAANAAANERQFQDFIANEAMNQAIADNIRQNEMARVQQMSPGGVQFDTIPFFESSRAPLVDQAAADARLAINPQVNQVFDMNDPAGDIFLNPSLQDPLLAGPQDSVDFLDALLDFNARQRSNTNDISVAGTNLPPATITDESGTTFNTTTGEIINDIGDASYFGDLGAGFERIDGPMVPTPPPPRFQTNAQRDFFEGLASQGDAAINAFNRELRNLDNRGFIGSQIAGGIGADGVPNYDLSAPGGQRIRGVTTTNFVDLPFVGTVPMSTYTGLDNPNAPVDTSENETTPPVTNPLTGTSRCPDGFIFDDDLQACRRKTRSELADTGTGGSPAPSTGDIFYRRSILDDAPANLPAGFDFNAANRRFIESYGVRPDNYRMPLSLTGFTRL